MFSFAIAFSFQKLLPGNKRLQYLRFPVEVTAAYTTDRKHCSCTTVWAGE
jgi:hypothetical protein